MLHSPQAINICHKEFVYRFNNTASHFEFQGYVSVINQEVILSDAELQREEVALMQE